MKFDKYYGWAILGLAAIALISWYQLTGKDSPTTASDGTPLTRTEQLSIENRYEIESRIYLSLSVILGVLSVMWTKSIK